MVSIDRCGVIEWSWAWRVFYFQNVVFLILQRPQLLLRPHVMGIGYSAIAWWSPKWCACSLKGGGSACASQHVHLWVPGEEECLKITFFTVRRTWMARNLDCKIGFFLRKLIFFCGTVYSSFLTIIFVDFVYRKTGTHFLTVIVGGKMVHNTKRDKETHQGTTYNTILPSQNDILKRKGLNLLLYHNMWRYKRRKKPNEEKKNGFFLDHTYRNRFSIGSNRTSFSYVLNVSSIGWIGRKA